MNDNPNGTYHCPICGVDAPHEHSGGEVGEWRAEEKAHYKKKQAEAGKLAEEQKQRRQVLQEQYKQEYENKLKSIQDFIAKQNCEFCGWIPKGGHRLKHGCDWQYGFIIDKKQNAAYCPQCGGVVAEWE